MTIVETLDRTDFQGPLTLFGESDKEQFRALQRIAGKREEALIS